ncbi:putative RNA-directed DNA polymerase, eukaryota, reverse transcriptase zinc-binding domain protein [Tanacetum coccineum]|uniref:RNA-directed DNA polymerase, eukaryota, reverse transcriptase zinc-binding domain protein n=1 Tax=Tanacetum coccineum TaxID=301880 RepID=A0ABQ5H7Q9_9ASTR
MSSNQLCFDDSELIRPRFKNVDYGVVKQKSRGGQEGLDIPKKDNGIGDNADEPIDSDLFGLDSLIKQRCVKINEVKCFETPEFPPGFTPNPSINQKDSISCNKSVNGASKQHSSNWGGNLVVMGDFNEVRDASERFGSVLNERQTDIFNEFITNSSLIDISLGGFKFTWTDKSGSKMSKLDPFLISKSFYDVFPHVTYVVLKKGIPDHRPILLKDFKVDFGPTSFRGFISFKKKLQNLKRVIRGWVASKRVDSNMLKLEHQSRLTLIDAKINQDCASEEDFNNRRDSMRILDDLQSMENKDLAQKDKIKTGVRIEDPIKVNAKFYDHFRKRFQHEDPIKRLVAPGPDGFSFKFITTFWDLLKEDVFVNDFRPINLIACQYKIIGKLLANRLSSVIESCISPEKIVFIKGRNILDGPIILNEVMAWYRKRKKTLMVFKFDFEKAFDSLSNLLGICVPDETVSDMAYFIGCGAASFPMKYLGVRVGCTMASRIKQKGIDLLSYCIRKVGDGASTKFWEDIWCGDQALKVLFLAYICSTWTCFVLLRTKFLFKTCVLLLGDILEVVRKWFNSQTYKQRLRILCCWIKAILGIGL